MDLDALEALEQAATPGPWRVEPFDDDPRELAICGPVGVKGAIVATDVPLLPADAALIAAVRNVLPALIAAARAALET